MPWKKLGRKWHLMRKGFLKGRVVWEPAVIEKLTELLAELWPEAKVDWTQKVLVNYHHGAKEVATLVTKRPEGLDLELYAPPAVALGQIADLGIDPADRPAPQRRRRHPAAVHEDDPVASPKLREFLLSCPSRRRSAVQVKAEIL